jgi:hypothetical protein
VIPNYAKAADGSPRAAARLTVRRDHGLRGLTQYLDEVY